MPSRFAPPKHHIPMDRNEQFEVLAELTAAYAKIERLGFALADLTDMNQCQIKEIEELKKDLARYKAIQKEKDRKA